ncbi:hypothetical protein JW905_18470 [bacterium]|nr:hypothetical protein [candidate division CSSED10-310 bacterium]
MPSSLTWIDHDAAARERSLRILALFQERESRDELGLGGIRDSFAEQFFPGTSTIQTRLRYMLFVPWIYTKLEERRVPPGDFARQADRNERDLIDAMRNVGEREMGVFGGRSGRQLKRLPSSVYWAGLGAWGIRVTDLSLDQYHRQIGIIYHRRKEQANRDQESIRRGDDMERTPAQGTVTWHPRLPLPPDDFPASADFKLTREEAGFLLDRIQRAHPASLLAHLALHCEPADVSTPWEHPDRAGFSPAHLELLEHARIFSSVIHGAALVYNLALAVERGWAEKRQQHDLALQQWIADLDQVEIRHWLLARFWQLTLDRSHAITPTTRSFVQSWVGGIQKDGAGFAGTDEARDLVRTREMSLKKSRSRFTNRRALDQWGGSSGLLRMVYRWPTASTLLEDLYLGLHQAGSE